MQNTIFDKKIQISHEIMEKKDEQLNKKLEKIQEYGNYFKKNYNNKSLKKDFIGLTKSEKTRFESANYIEKFISSYDIKQIQIIQKSDELIFKFPTSELFIKNLGKIADTASSFYLNKNKFRCYKGEDTGLHYMVKAFSTYLEIEVLKQKINFQCENEIKNFENLFLNTDKVLNEVYSNKENLFISIKIDQSLLIAQTFKHPVQTIKDILIKTFMNSFKSGIEELICYYHFCQAVYLEGLSDVNCYDD